VALALGLQSTESQGLRGSHRTREQIRSAQSHPPPYQPVEKLEKKKRTGKTAAHFPRPSVRARPFSVTESSGFFYRIGSNNALHATNDE